MIMFDALGETLSKFVDKELTLVHGQTLFRAGESVRNIYLVRKGRVTLLRRQRDCAALASNGREPAQRYCL
jgi:CRP-like cAMP-binding protein